MIRDVIKKKKVFQFYVSFLRPIKLLLLGGYQLYRIAKRKRDDEIVVLMTPGIGDDVYGLAFLKCLKQWKSKRIVVYALESKKQLFDYYSNVIDKIVYFTKADPEWKRCQDLSQVGILRRISRKKDIYTILIYPYYHNPRYDDGRSWLRILKEDVFQFPLDVSAEIQYPNFSDIVIHTIPDFEMYKSRIVVLNPYSVSMDNSMMSLYEKIASFLLDKGYIVYTNVVGDQQAVVGSLPLNVSIFEFYAICNQIPMIISTRSGIIDLVISAKSNFLIYYFPFVNNDWQFDIKTFLHRYTLTAWNTGNVEETIYNDNQSALAVFSSFYTRVNLY